LHKKQNVKKLNYNILTDLKYYSLVSLSFAFYATDESDEDVIEDFFDLEETEEDLDEVPLISSMVDSGNFSTTFRNLFDVSNKFDFWKYFYKQFTPWGKVVLKLKKKYSTEKQKYIRYLKEEERLDNGFIDLATFGLSLNDEDDELLEALLDSDQEEFTEDEDDELGFHDLGEFDYWDFVYLTVGFQQRLHLQEFQVWPCWNFPYLRYYGRFAFLKKKIT